MYTVLNEETVRMIAPGKITEFVRGTDVALVAHVEPLVRRGNVLLDCRAVTRIDAAGIAALITLYATAQDAGHSFHVFNLRPHIEEIVALVGLDRILVAAKNDQDEAHLCASLIATAA